MTKMMSALCALSVSCFFSQAVQNRYREDSAPTDESLPVEQKSLTQDGRRKRLEVIRDVSRESGLANAAMLAGVASAETGLAHCWSEARWSCQGPWSADCNGPVIAGAGDGPCSWQEGGLGMFQFDGGTFDQTLLRDGRGVLTLRGNVTKAVDFVANMLMSSRYVSVSSRAAALNWLSGVRPGTARFEAWIKTVTHHYNGCEPGYCSIFWDRYDHYAYHAKLVYDEVSAGFWSTGQAPQTRPESSHHGGPVDAIELWWSRLNDGSYAFKSIAPSRVHRMRYLVDGYVIADQVSRDDPRTAEIENNFPARYRFSSETMRRQVLVEGLDSSGRVVARGVGLLDAIAGTGVYIRQVAQGVYQVGLERAPGNVASLSVSANGYDLVDSISGRGRSERLAVRSAFTLLGQRDFKLIAYDVDGYPVLSVSRSFELR